MKGHIERHTVKKPRVLNYSYTSKTGSSTQRMGQSHSEYRDQNPPTCVEQEGFVIEQLAGEKQANYLRVLYMGKASL